MTGNMSDPARQIAASRKDMAEFATLWQAVAGRSAPAARAEAEAQVFNQMVVALDSRFGSNGVVTEASAAREVQLLAQGVAVHGGWFPEAGAARWQPDASVTGYQAGDRIALSEEVFTRLTGVYLDGVARKFSVR